MNHAPADAPLRLFIALPIPEPVRAEIFRAQRELQRLAAPGAVRWTPPEQFHLTLKFLGDLPAERVAALHETVAAMCAGFPALQLRADGIGFFPNLRKPRVVWTGVADDKRLLAELQRQIENAVQPFTTQPAAENFVGHATLGRIKTFRRREIEALLAQAESLANRCFGEWTADTAEIIRSELAAAGARHTLLAACPLAA